MDEGKEVMTHDQRAILPVHPLEENRIGVTGPKGPDGDGRGSLVLRGAVWRPWPQGWFPGGTYPKTDIPLGCASIAFGVPNALAGAPEPVCRALTRGKELWNTEQGTFTLGPGSMKPSIRN